MFTLGKRLDPYTRELTSELLQYDPDDLTTHAVCVGMTGSGKTGLCLDLLEEAALAGLPAIIIDPKGDIANLLLQFPDLKAEDFQPWINVDDARRAKLSAEAFAAQEAERWRAGLAEWGYGPEQMRRLKETVDWAVYTPGSDAGRPVSVLKSLEAPDLAWEDNQELLRERISGICSALLGLIGLEADPVKSREHILLANIFESAWKAGQALDLAALITQVQTPPFAKLGVFEVERFYPEKDRMALALALNAIVAAPAFQSWIQGEALDVAALLRAPDGKPRISIFYVAHLTEAERMFFIALLLEQVATWLRGQSGTTSLRALLYFDEVYGYFPPHPHNPPTKAPLMRLLKQARAFGLGLMLVTQNPGDLDYKGLTNTGTWFIGKLQTERDKARLLEGLETISAQARSTLNIADLDTLIASLAPRTFLLQNIHQAAPVVFHTRWAMSYLAGPLTREQIRKFKPEVRRQASEVSSPVKPAEVKKTALSGQRPVIPANVASYFLAAAKPAREALMAWRMASGRQVAVLVGTPEIVYRPALLAQAVVRYISTKAEVNSDRRFTFVVHAPTSATAPHWDEHVVLAFEAVGLSHTPPTSGQWATELPDILTNAKKLEAWKKDLQTYLYRTADLALHQNPTLKLFSQPGQSYAEFRATCVRAATVRRDEELAKIRERYDKKLDDLEAKRVAEERDHATNREQLRAREDEARWTTAENILGVVLGRSPRRLFSESASKDRLKKKAEAEVNESAQTMVELTARIEALKAEAQAAFQTVVEKWNGVAHDIKELRLTPRRADILIEAFGIGWLPYWQFEVEGERVEVEAF